MRGKIYIFMFILILLTFGSSWAMDFHVSTVGEFQAALIQAQDNEEDDTIYLAAGTYSTVNNRGTFSYVSSKGYNLTIKAEEGVTPEQVVLDGENAYRVLYLHDYSNTYNRLILEGLTIQNGYSTENGGGVFTIFEGEVILNNNIITRNRTEESGGGIYTYSYSVGITLTNNTISYNAAGSSGGGISAGSYTGGVTLVNNTITGNTAVRGGGVEASASYSYANITITGNVITGNTADELGGGVYAPSGCGAVIIRNNTITDNVAAGGGGGVYVDSSSGTVALDDNTITGNKTIGDYHRHGGGVSVESSSGTVTLTDNIISGNSTEADWCEGGGVYVRSRNGKLNLINNTITNNTGAYKGGGVSVYAESNLQIALEGNILEGNSGSSKGGGIYIASYSESPISLTNNTIAGNTSNMVGGGIYVESDHGMVSFTNNNIKENASFRGGGICAISFSGIFTFKNNIIEGNTADSQGGGVYAVPDLNYGDDCTNTFSFDNNTITGNNTGWWYGGGVYATARTTTFTNNIITRNSGGGIYVHSFITTTLTNNTISGNRVMNYTAGGVYLASSSDTVTRVYNNIIWGNIASSGSDIYLYGDGVFYGYNNDYHDIYGTWTYYSGNISAAPMFVDPENGDYHLQPGSACIDVGTNDVLQLPDIDIDGDERIVNGVVDIGADEYVETALILSFPFEDDGETTPDSSGNGNNGIVNGAVFSVGEGILNSNAYRFAWFSRNNIQIPYKESQTITHALTLEAWIYPTAWDNIYFGYNRIVSKQPLYLLRGVYGRAHFQILTENHGYQGVYDSQVLSLNEWHYVVGTFDGQYLKLYIDGTLRGTTKLPEEDRISINEADIFVGESPVLNEGFTGIIDNVAIYKRARLQSEIEKTYASIMLGCEGDFDRDGDVDGSDLAIFAADFGRTDCNLTGDCEGDFDYDGDVDGSDLAVFAADFGRTDCPCWKKVR